MPASLMRICVVLAVTVCALDATAAAFLKRSGTEQASLLPTDAQNKVTLAVQMKKLKEESAEDFKKCIGNVDEAQVRGVYLSWQQFLFFGETCNLCRVFYSLLSKLVSSAGALFNNEQEEL